MRIGKLAKVSGVGVETVRFYEQKGLIARPPRPADGGYRDYPDVAARRIGFIRSAQRLGFSLVEIAELLDLDADPAADCADVRGRAIEKRDEVEEKIARLRGIRDALDLLIASCPGGGAVGTCSILEAMNRGTGGGAAPVPATNATSERKRDMQKTTVLTIEGMRCDGCAQTIEALLTRVPGVLKAEASYEERRARILHDRDSASEADLAAAVARGGFKVEVVPR